MNEQRLVQIGRDHMVKFRNFLDRYNLRQDFEVKIGIGDLSEFPNTRNVAYTAMINPNYCEMVFAPKWKQLTDENYIAVLRHEFGHVLHMMCPQVYIVCAALGLDVDEDKDELFSDLMASVIFGDHIYYDHDLIQTITPTHILDRPRHLGC